MDNPPSIESLNELLFNITERVQITKRALQKSRPSKEALVRYEIFERHCTQFENLIGIAREGVAPNVTHPSISYIDVLRLVIRLTR